MIRNGLNRLTSGRRKGSEKNKTQTQIPRWKVQLHREQRRSRGSLTCSQETVGRQHELGRDLHLAVGVVLEGGEVGLVFVGVHLLPVPVVGCRGRKEA